MFSEPARLLSVKLNVPPEELSKDKVVKELNSDVAPEISTFWTLFEVRLKEVILAGTIE